MTWEAWGWDPPPHGEGEEQCEGCYARIDECVCPDGTCACGAPLWDEALLCDDCLELEGLEPALDEAV